MKISSLFLFTAVLCISLFFSCTSNIELPPPPDDLLSSSSEQPSSSSAVASNSSSSEADASSSSEQPSSSSPVALSSSSFNEVAGSSSSSPGGGNGNSSSGGSGDGSSSGESGGGSSSGGQQSSSSSSFGGGDRSSESQALGTFDGTYFTDPRDGKRYKYEIAPAAGGGKIWMKENLNYSRGNTLGWCYVVNGKTLGTAGADLSGCESPNGRAYTYNIAIDGNKPQGLCPRGWHIPSVDEWTTLGAGTASAMTGNRRMSSAFYVYAGNYDAVGYEGRTNGWYERDKNGFYWANNNKNSFVVMGTNNGNYFYSKSDATDNEYYSIRCVADDGTFNVSSSSGATSTSSSSTTSSNNSSSSATPVCGVVQFCSGAELLWNQTTINGSINTANKCYFTKQITASNGNSGIGILINGKEINGTNCPGGNLLPDCPLLNSKVDGGYYIKLSKAGGYADITMSADKPPCGGSSSSSGGGNGDEATYCSGATKTIDITFGSNNNVTEQANTTNAICFKIAGIIVGWTAANAQGRTCKANGGSAASVDNSGNITQSAVNAINGYVYINCSAGTNSSFSISPYK